MIGTKASLFFACLPLSAATITGSVWCLGISQQPGSMACSSDLSSATALFMPGTLFPDLRVDTAAINPSVAQASLHYDGIFNLTVSGTGTGFVEPIMWIAYTQDPALSAEAMVTFGSVQLYGSSTGGHRYNFAIPVTFGETIQVELKLDVQATTGFALFPPSVTSAGSFAEATLQDLWVLDAALHRTPGTVTFSEASRLNRAQNAVPEPSYAPVFLLLAVGLGCARLTRFGPTLHPPMRVKSF